MAFQLAAAQLQPAPLALPGPPSAIAEKAEQEPPPPSDIGDEPAIVANPAQSPKRADEAESIVVTAKSRDMPGDPLGGFNHVSFDTVQAVDSAVTGPVARAYKKTLPSSVRSGLRNFLRNLQEPVVFVNYMLQLKPGKGAETLGRFAINSTIGVAGVVDVAKRRPFHLPHQTNGFAYTLGYYGIGSGPYMFLPLIGPTTARDLVGRVGDLAFLPVAVGGLFKDPIFGLTTTTIRLVDERAESDEGLRKLFETERNPYAAVRDDYLRRRQREIDQLRGRQTAGTTVPPAQETTNPALATPTHLLPQDTR